MKQKESHGGSGKKQSKEQARLYQEKAAKINDLMQPPGQWR